MLLRSVMVTHGFKPVVKEWWHFTLANEPYPDVFSIFRLSDGREVDASELAAIRVGDCIRHLPREAPCRRAEVPRSHCDVGEERELIFPQRSLFFIAIS